MPSQPAHILLVEDDEVEAEAIFRSFARQKVINPIVHASNGLEALAILRGANAATPLPHPYIILLDINLPQMNGIEFLQTIRQDPALKYSVVFVLTTSEREEDKLAAYNEQIAGYILKANAGRDFLEMLQLLDSYQLLVELPGNCHVGTVKRPSRPPSPAEWPGRDQQPGAY